MEIFKGISDAWRNWRAPKPEAAPPEQLDQITGPRFVEILEERVKLRKEKKSGALNAATDAAALPADREQAKAKLDRLTLLESTPALQRYDELWKKVSALKKEQTSLKGTAPTPADIQKALNDLTAHKASLQTETTELGEWQTQLSRWEAVDARHNELYDQLNPNPAPATPMDPAEWQQLKDEYDQIDTELNASVDPTGKQQHQEVAMRSQHVDQIQDDVNDAQGEYAKVENHQRQFQANEQDLARFSAELKALSTTGFNAAAAPTASTEAGVVVAPLSIVTPPLPSETSLGALLKSERTASGSVIRNIGGRDYHFGNDATGRRTVKFMDDKNLLQNLTVEELARRDAQPINEATKRNLDRIQRTVDEKQVQRGGRASGGIPASIAQQLIADINNV